MIFSCAVLIIVHHHVEGPVQQGNRASEALDEGFEELIAPACLFELSAV